MTEVEWLTCAHPYRMQEHLRGKTKPRKMRLFACACCRIEWTKLDEEFRTAVEVAERFADGLASKTELKACWHATRDALRATGRPPWTHIACEAAWYATRNPRSAARHPLSFPNGPHRQRQIAHFYDIFGRFPFHPASADSTWLTSTVVALAQGIYAERAFDQLPILADALQDAGCENEDMLSHCRDPQLTHVRGCWVVDLLLGKH